jgi:site-specific recombinase XerD
VAVDPPRGGQAARAGGRCDSRAAASGTALATERCMTAPAKLLDLVRRALRLRHYSARTERAYCRWVVRYILVHDKRHPSELGAPHVAEFLEYLAEDRRVSAGTQNQALAALLFLYHDVLALSIERDARLIRARGPERVPVVLTTDEIAAMLDRMPGPTKLMASLLYGSGLRLLECACLRVKDLDFARQ